MCRTGFFLDGRFAWETDPGWERELGYAEDTRVTDVTMQHAELGLRVRFTDYVDMARDWLRRRPARRDRIQEGPLRQRPFSAVS